MAETERDLRSGIVALLPKLRRFAFGLCGAAHDADDLVQSAVERALRNEAQWNPGTRLDSWMYKIVQNLWIDKGRQQRTRGEAAPLEEAMGQAGDDARETLETRDAAARALKALAALSPEMRSAATLVIISGHSYREAAEALDVPVGTIMSRVARARGALEAALSSGDE
jgi:RNA polymerase sigma-70 factor (ECF subfamily)